MKEPRETGTEISNRRGAAAYLLVPAIVLEVTKTACVLLCSC